MPNFVKFQQAGQLHEICAQYGIACSQTRIWDAAGNEYAEEFARVYNVIHNVTTWSRQIFMENGLLLLDEKEQCH